MDKELLYYIEGVDDTIIQLNKFLIHYQYEFIKYDLNEFEKKFIHFFTLEDDYEKFGKISFSTGLNNSGSLSIPFVEGLQKSRHFNYPEIFLNNYIIFLKDGLANDDTITEEFDLRLQDLINKLKLFKTGHLKLVSSFIIVKEKKWIFATNYSLPFNYPTDLKYSLNQTESEDLKYFRDILEIPSYLEVAFNSFIEHYNIEDNKVKFIVLMISLESVFNKSGQDPISHIISRHVALMIAKNKIDFFEIYEQTKKLYNIRSSIVHGKEEKDSKKFLKEISENILKLEEFVRTVLKRLIWIHDFENNTPRDKKELWNYLNAKGFEG